MDRERVGVIVSDSTEVFSERYSDLMYAHREAPTLWIEADGASFAHIRFELHRADYLHLHSVVLLDGDGRQIKAAGDSLSMSSSYGRLPPRSSCARLFAPNGKHAIAFHTNKDGSPWVQVGLRNAVNPSRILVKNRKGPYAVRASGLRVLVSSDGESWRLLYDGADRETAFHDACVERAGGAGDDRTARQVAAISAKALTGNYAGMGKLLQDSSMDAEEKGHVRRSVNEFVLAPRQLEWTSHGVRRSFRYWSEEEKADYVALTRRVCEDLTELSPDVCFGFGSVLSIIRDAELMKHDDDLDVIIGLGLEVAPSLRQALTIVRTHLEARGYVVRGKFLSHWHVVRDGKKVDVFVGLYEQGDLIGWFPGGRRALQREDVFPAASVSFMGSECPIPRKPEHYLETIYGRDWRSPAPGWSHNWDRAAYKDIA